MQSLVILLCAVSSFDSFFFLSLLSFTLGAHKLKGQVSAFLLLYQRTNLMSFFTSTSTIVTVNSVVPACTRLTWKVSVIHLSNYEFDFFLELESSFFLNWDKQFRFLLDSRTPYSLLYTLPIFPSSTAGFLSGIQTLSICYKHALYVAYFHKANLKEKTFRNQEGRVRE